jgi:hypothetical protein
MLIGLIAILWVFIWALTLVDLFRRDWGTGKKAAWAIIMLVVPVIGVLAYLIVRPPSAADGDSGMNAPDQASEAVRDRHPV